MKAILAAVLVMSCSSMNYAMSILTDQALSNTTGQDGLTLSVTLPATINLAHLYWHDKDGLTGASGQTAKSGGLIEFGSGLGIRYANSNPIIVKIDADGGTSGTKPVLNINMSMGAGQLGLGRIVIAPSNRNTVGGATATSATRGSPWTSYKYITNGDTTVNMGGLSANFQLGSQTQGALAKLTGTMSGGLSISNISINDDGGGGTITVDKVSVTDTGSTSQLTLNESIKATTSGLEFTHISGKMDILIENLKVGSNSSGSIGDIELVGLDLSGTKVAITGH